MGVVDRTYGVISLLIGTIPEDVWKIFLHGLFGQIKRTTISSLSEIYFNKEGIIVKFFVRKNAPGSHLYETALQSLQLPACASKSHSRSFHGL